MWTAVVLRDLRKRQAREESVERSADVETLLNMQDSVDLNILQIVIILK